MTKTIASLLLISATSLQAALYNYNMSADNDMALYTGTITGSSLVEHFNQTNDWDTPNVGSFNSNQDYVYVVGMNFTLVASFAGFINNTDLSTIPWEVSTNVSSSLTGYTGNTTTYNPVISEVAALIATETFSPAALTGDISEGVGIAGVADAIDIPDGDQTAYIFRTAASNLVPEPSTTLLGFGAAGLALLRRRRTAA